jgi:hypothetical protein
MVGSHERRAERKRPGRGLPSTVVVPRSLIRSLALKLWMIGKKVGCTQTGIGILFIGVKDGPETRVYLSLFWMGLGPRAKKVILWVLKVNSQLKMRIPQTCDKRGRGERCGIEILSERLCRSVGSPQRR